MKTYLNKPVVEYFKSIPELGKEVALDNCYDIKFSFPVELGLYVANHIRQHTPDLVKYLTSCWVDSTKGKYLVIGGRFPASINAKRVIFGIIDARKK